MKRVEREIYEHQHEAGKEERCNHYPSLGLLREKAKNNFKSLPVFCKLQYFTSNLRFFKA